MKLWNFLLIGLILFFLSLFSLYVFYSCNPILANKHDYYLMIMNNGGQFMIPQQLYDPNKTNLEELNYPIIMKPNVCSGEGRQVSKIKNVKEAKEYINKFDKSWGDNIVIQQFDPAPYEVGVLYRKYPGEKHGKIISLGNRSKNKSSDKTNSGKFVPRSCHNVDCSDKSEWLTPKNKAILINEIEKMSGINVCRLDILFDNLDDFKKGKNFRIIEVNGRMGFNLANYSIKSKLSRMINNLFWLSERFLIGLMNIMNWTGLNIFLFLKNIFWKGIMAVRENNPEFLITQDYYESSLLK